MKKLLFIVLILFTIFSSKQFAQINSVSAGAAIGMGEIKGNSPSVTSFSGRLFLEVEPSFWRGIYFRLNFFYSRKVDYLLPESRLGRYYPFLKGISLEAFIDQYLSKSFYLEEGIGPLFLNDRTFADTNTWDIGMVFNVLLGYDLSDEIRNGFRLGLGSEFGGTFTNTSASYFTIYLQGQYHFN